MKLKADEKQGLDEAFAEVFDAADELDTLINKADDARVELNDAVHRFNKILDQIEIEEEPKEEEPKGDGLEKEAQDLANKVAPDRGPDGLLDS